MNNLENEVKALIIEALNLEDMTPEDIETDAPLFGEGLGLDSIDAVDMIVHLQNMIGKRIKPEAFKSVRTVGDVVDVIYDFSQQNGEAAN